MNWRIGLFILLTFVLQTWVSSAQSQALSSLPLDSLNPCSYDSHFEQVIDYKKHLRSSDFEPLCVTLSKEGGDCSMQSIGAEAQRILDSAKSDPKLHEICCGSSETCKTSLTDLKLIFKDGTNFLAQAKPDGYITFNRTAKFSGMNREFLRATVYHELGHKCFDYKMSLLDDSLGTNQKNLAAKALLCDDLYQCIIRTVREQAVSSYESYDDYEKNIDTFVDWSLGENFATTLPMRILHANPSVQVNSVMYTAVSQCFFKLTDIKNKWCERP